MAEQMIDNLLRLRAACMIVQHATGKQKQAALRDVCSDPYIERGLTLLLDPLRPFGIRSKRLDRPVKAKPDKAYADLLDMCEELSEKKGLSDTDIANVQQFIRQVSDPMLAFFARDYVTKSIALGVAAVTFNQALGKRVLQQPECMLAKKYFEHADKVHGKAFTITEKLDGIRALASVKDGQAFILSRQGVRIDGLTEIEEDLLRLYRQLGERNFTLDGELLVDHRERLPSKEQYKQTTMIVRKDGEKHGVTYHVFDCTEYLWNERSFYQLPYRSRRQFLRDWCFKQPEKYAHIQLVPVLYSGTDENMILECLNIQRAQGGEGVMVNLNDAPYTFGRTADILKVKVMQDCDLQIVDVQEGAGKYAGTLGALIVDYKGTRVGVGTGLSDEDRAEFWQNRDKYIGRIATIQYFEETCDAKGIPSIRFPVYKELREQGKEVSYN